MPALPALGRAAQRARILPALHGAGHPLLLYQGGKMGGFRDGFWMKITLLFLLLRLCIAFQKDSATIGTLPIKWSIVKGLSWQWSVRT